MQKCEMLTILKGIVNDPSVGESTLESYLSLAESKIKQRCYPFGSDRPIPERYQMLCIELASRYIHRRGIEGETSNTDNGITRRFDSPNDEDILKEVMQVIGV